MFTAIEVCGVFFFTFEYNKCVGLPGDTSNMLFKSLGCKHHLAFIPGRSGVSLKKYDKDVSSL